jgi:hypothetical protein
LALTADSILARSTRRRQTTGWNTAYIGANRYTLPPDEKPPANYTLHPMAFLVEKGPGTVTRPHFHQADQFQVVVAGRGMLGDHELSDGAVHYPMPTRPMDRSSLGSRASGHEVVAGSPKTGVNSITGKGLKEAMAARRW